MTCVLDASAALSLVLADEFTDESQRIVDHVVEHGAIVPSLWQVEVANGLLSALRRGRTTELAVVQALTGLHRLPIRLDKSPPAAIDLVTLSSQFDLSAHHAAYLWLAHSRELPLATCDRELARAATNAGIALI